MIVVNSRFLTQPVTGVQRYSMEICRILKKSIPTAKFITPKNILHLDMAKELEAISIGEHRGHFWEQIELPKYLKKNSSPLLINLANTAPILYDNKISTIHDIAFERFPESFTWPFRTAYKAVIPKIIKTSRHVITVSNFSKAEICSLYRVNPSKVSVINNASTNFSTSTSTSNEKYILAVSSLNRQKNFDGLIEAFSLIKDKKHKLYIVGSINNNFSGTDISKKIASNGRIKLLGRVSDMDLGTLYSRATAFVHPSFYEGFGIPPLEAQACGCPVIVSRAASLPEVFSNSALYCNPYDINDIAEKMDLLLSDPQIGQDLSSKGYENVKRYSWEKSANILIDIIKDHQ